MQKMSTHLLWLVGLVAVLAMTVAGCGGGGDGDASGNEDLSGATLTVGSKNFTEQLILGNIALLALENAGANVNDQIGLAGSVAARQALTSGEVDTYWEYTGTGWITYLEHSEPVYENPQEYTSLTDGDYEEDNFEWLPTKPEKQYEAVAEEDLDKNNIKWLPAAPANNTFVIAVREEAYEDLGVEQLSDFNQLLQENQGEATICVDSEFATRNDGLPGLEEAYNFDIPDSNVNTMGVGVIPEAIDKGERCNFGVMQATDGRIQGLGLEVVEDNKDFFPIYNPSLTLRQETFDNYPQIEEIMVPISKELDTETLKELNAQVDVEGQLPDTVAEQWLEENGFMQ